MEGRDPGRWHSLSDSISFVTLFPLRNQEQLQNAVRQTRYGGSVVAHLKAGLLAFSQNIPKNVQNQI